jgi:hypothetical protein
MHLRRALAFVGAVTAAAFTACKELPFAPRWDADMFMPLSTQPIYLSTYFTLGVIPPASSASVSFPAQQQAVSGVLGTVLKNMVTDQSRCSSAVNPALTCHMLKLTVSKTKPITATDTLFLANAQGNLNAAGPGTVVFPISLATTDSTKSDSVFLTPASVNMLQLAGKNSAPLWIQLRGQVANPGASPITITSADSLGITLSVTVRVAVVHK